MLDEYMMRLRDESYALDFTYPNRPFAPPRQPLAHRPHGHSAIRRSYRVSAPPAPFGAASARAAALSGLAALVASTVLFVTVALLATAAPPQPDVALIAHTIVA